jgi:thioredoxin 1
MIILTQDNIADLHNVIEGANVLYFTASWCGPCKQLGPQMDALEGEFKAEDVNFFKVPADDDATKDLLATYGVRSLPTLVLLKDGKEAKRMVGAQPITVIANAIDTLLEDEF